MHWYLVHTKPRHEKCALENLQRQGYECYLPLLRRASGLDGSLKATEEPIFPRYLFIRLDRGDSGKSWGPVRSTRGVSRLVSFGLEPAKVDDRLINALKSQENSRAHVVDVSDSPVVEYVAELMRISNGERRVMALVELLALPEHTGQQAFSHRKVG